MALSYTTLVADKTTAGSIKSWVNYARNDIEYVLEEAQTEIFQRIRTREMRTLETFAVVSGDYYKALPTGVLEVLDLRSVDNLSYIQVSEETLQAKRIFVDDVITQGQPSFYAIFDERVQWDCKFTLATTMMMFCYKTPTLLSSSNLTNFLTSRYPHVLRTACLMKTADFLRNETEYAKHSARLEELCFAMNAESDLTHTATLYETSIR